MVVSGPGRVPALDGARGVAILAVLAGHAAGMFGAVLSWSGVTLFFVLSGYLITGRLLTGQTLRRFWTNRARRLLPGLLVMLAVTGTYFVIVHGVRLWLLLEPLLYVRNVTGTHFGTGPSPWAQTWSLAQEEQFYVLWPLVFLAWPGRRRQLVAVVGVLSYVAMLVALVVGEGGIARFSPVTQAWPLCLGCWLALRAWSPRWPAWLEVGWLRWFGVRSYGMYLWHYPIVIALMLADVPGAEVLGCVAGVAVAAVSWRYVEEPWLRPSGAVRPVRGRSAVQRASGSGNRYAGS